MTHEGNPYGDQHGHEQNSWKHWLSKEHGSSHLSLEEQISRNLAGKDIAPHDRHYPGMAAIWATNDNAREGFFDMMQEMHPDGYIVGIGSGGILSLLEGFPPDSTPNGIIMADINPWVVAAARQLRDELLHAKNADEFLPSLYLKNQILFNAEIMRIARKDTSLRSGIERWEKSMPWKPTFTKKEIQAVLNGTWGPESDYCLWYLSKSLHIPSVLYNHFDQLKGLAKEGKIAAFYTDFRNPDFVDAVSSLPDFFEGTSF